jgi:SAM-dependent methyltransferase
MFRRMYYKNKQATLAELFGTPDIEVREDSLRVGSYSYPIVQDVIILSDPGHRSDPRAFAEDIQFTFGEEWKTYSAILPEHRDEFERYFDLVNLQDLQSARVCDLGCGMGRWSYYLKDACKELVLVDFSDAIFMARKNLAGASNALFFKADLKRLPFRENFADFMFSLGVLHHLPTPCLDEVRALKPLAPQLLIFLYYALDNRPWYFRLLLGIVTAARRVLSRIRQPALRMIISRAGTWLIYLPLIFLGRLLDVFNVGRYIPLYEFYHDKSLKRIEQDVYDRFFTRIEQRVTRHQILGLKDTFREVTVSEKIPYWHFVCKR